MFLQCQGIGCPLSPPLFLRGLEGYQHVLWLASGGLLCRESVRPTSVGLHQRSTTGRGLVSAYDVPGTCSLYFDPREPRGSQPPSPRNGHTESPAVLHRNSARLPHREHSGSMDWASGRSSPRFRIEVASCEKVLVPSMQPPTERAG